MSKLKWIAAIRHCQDFGSHNLTEYGIEQAQCLADVIKQQLPVSNDAILVLSSPPGRAKKTAEIIAETLSATVLKCEELEFDGYGDGESQRKAIEKFLKEEHAVMIAVTHYEAPSGIINAFSRKHLGKSYPANECPKGKGLVLNLETGDVIKIP